MHGGLKLDQKQSRLKTMPRRKAVDRGGEEIKKKRAKEKSKELMSREESARKKAQ